MKSKRHTITIFGSSQPHPGEPAYEEARELGTELARAGFALCNGGYGGTMEATARGAKDYAAMHLPDEKITTGVTCSAFGNRTANRWIDNVQVTDTIFERLQRLIALGDGYVTLRGGTGTLLELAAVLELINKQMIPPKPIVLIGPYWTDLIEMANRERETTEQLRRHSSLSIAETVTSCVTILQRHFYGESYAT